MEISPMRTSLRASATIIVSVAAVAGAFTLGRASASAEPLNGSTIEHDSVVAKTEAGPHKGGGQTTGYSFFAKSKDLPMIFRKRALHSGSSIGLHKQGE